MPLSDEAIWTLQQEGRSLLARLDRVRPLSLQVPMVSAAALTPAAHGAIERFLGTGRRQLRDAILGYLSWLSTRAALLQTAEQAHRRLILLRLRFYGVLTHLDIFSEAAGQRSQGEVGVWLRGLDVAAGEALSLPGYLEPPPVVCFLAREPGGAIRRAYTRLPGGGRTPVALIRLPRERMVGSGLASSLAHEVGHQAADLLDLVEGARSAVDPAPEQSAHRPWRAWMSEILADLWAISRVGVASTQGLISLVSLPRAFVFRTALDDPHPTPWLRVKLSCAIGDALHPHEQWGRLARLWESFYPPATLPPARAAGLRALEADIPRIVAALLAHRPAALGRRSLGEVLRRPQLRPLHLRRTREAWKRSPRLLRRLAPTVALAALGQARADGSVTPEAETEVLSELLKHWALRSALAPTRTGPTEAHAQWTN